MDTISYILFACDIICGIVFVTYIFYVFLKKNAPTIQRKITKLGSMILTRSKTSIHSRQTLQSPTSLQFSGPTDSPMSTERIMSTERFASIEKFMSAERFTSTENLMSTERFMSTEGLMPTERDMDADRPFSPVIRLRSTEEEMPTIRENDELQVFSPTSQTEAGLFYFGSEPRESSLPVDLQELELPAEDPDFHQFAEILKHETRNSPRTSRRNKINKVFKFTKEEWLYELSKKNSGKAQERKLQKSF